MYNTKDGKTNFCLDFKIFCRKYLCPLSFKWMQTWRAICQRPPPSRRGAPPPTLPLKIFQLPKWPENYCMDFPHHFFLEKTSYQPKKNSQKVTIFLKKFSKILKKWLKFGPRAPARPPSLKRCKPQRTPAPLPVHLSHLQHEKCNKKWRCCFDLIVCFCSDAPPKIWTTQVQHHPSIHSAGLFWAHSQTIGAGTCSTCYLWRTLPFEIWAWKATAVLFR